MYFCKIYGNNLNMIQLIGRNSDRDTKKVMMFLKERRIEFQFVDIDKKELSKKEWDSIAASVSSPDDLVDQGSKYYKKEGYSYREYNPLEEVILHPEMLKVPFLRIDRKAYQYKSLDELKEVIKCNTL